MLPVSLSSMTPHRESKWDIFAENKETLADD
jgi:hypothetical protein